MRASFSNAKVGVRTFVSFEKVLRGPGPRLCPYAQQFTKPLCF